MVVMIQPTQVIPMLLPMAAAAGAMSHLPAGGARSTRHWQRRGEYQGARCRDSING